MKEMNTNDRLVGLLAMVGAMLAWTNVQAIETNVWQGSSSGGNWNDQSNWTRALTPTVSSVYDFSALEDGAVVTNTYEFTKGTAEQLQIGGLIFGPNKGRVKLFGSSTSQTIFPTGTIFVPVGTTLDLSLRHTTQPWKDPGSTVLLAGNGDIVFDGDKFKGTMWTYKINGNGKTIMLGSKTAFTLCTFDFATAATCSDCTIRLTADTIVAGVKGPWFQAASNFIDNESYAFTSGTGYGGGSFYSYEPLLGTAPLTYEGGGTFTLRAAPRNTRKFTVRNANVFLGRSYNPNTAPTTSTAGATQLPRGVTLDIENSGVLSTFCDQFLSSLVGNGTCGGVNLSTNWAGTAANLEVIGSGVAETNTYNARISGLGGLVKRGSSTLVLTGDNSYTGATVVTEGTLAIRRPRQEVDGVILRYDFSGAAWSNANVGTFSTAQVGITHVEDGVPGYGPGALHFDGSDASPRFMSNLTPSVISNNNPFTISVWIRPDAGSFASDKKLTYLTFNGRGNWGTREMARMYIYGETNLNYTVGQYEAGRVSATNGVSADVAYDALHDGRWHQIAMTYGAGNILSGYFDGTCLGSVEIEGGLRMPADTLRSHIGTDVSSDLNRYFGDMDEWKIFTRALTAEEILADYKRATPVAESADRLPSPVWHRTFNVAIRPAEQLSLTGEDFPAGMPTGRSPFTVSCRYKPESNSSTTPLVAWGDIATANRFFLLGTDSNERRRPMIGYSLGMTTSVRISNSFTNITHSTSADSAEAAWTHIVCTYDGDTIRAYQDGHLAIDPIKSVSLDLQPTGLYVASLPGISPPFNGRLDDVQIFDVAMTPDQVRTFSRALKNANGKEGPVLPETASVSVGAGATFGIVGTSQKLKSLSGSGTLELGDCGETTLDAADSFVGTISGRGRLNVVGKDLDLADGSGFCGTLVVSNADLTVAGGLGNAYVSLLANASLRGAGTAEVVCGPDAILGLDTASPATPALSTTGAVTLDGNLTIRMSSRDIRGTYTLVSAGSLSLPASFENWTLCDANGQSFPADAYSVKFVAAGGVLNMTVSGAGVTIIFR